MFSMPLSSSSAVSSWGTTPITSLTFAGCLVTSCPATVALPLVIDAIVFSILIVVVFPAPLGPRNPKISPSST